MSLGWAGEMAPSGGEDALQQLLTTRMQMARDAEAVRQHQADEKIRQSAIDENAAYRHDQFRSEDATRKGNLAIKQSETFPEDTPVGPDDQANWNKAGIGGLLRTRPLDATALPAATVPTLSAGLQTIGGLTAMPGPQVTGTNQAAQVPTTPVPGQIGDKLSIPTAKNQQAADRLDLLNQIAAAKADTAASKANTLKLSASGGAAMRSIEAAAPMSDQALSALEAEFPGIGDPATREKYNTNGSLANSISKTGKYWLGLQDPDDPRMQVIKLLQPLQAGQFTLSSRSYKMVELALQHMADPRQTPARQYEALQTLRMLMPEMRDAIIRAEQPIDLAHPDAHSYFGGSVPTPPPLPGTAAMAAGRGGAPAPSGGPAAGSGPPPPKEQRTIGMKWNIPGLGPGTWTGAGWAPDTPRPNDAAPAPAGAAAPAPEPTPPADAPAAAAPTRAYAPPAALDRVPTAPAPLDSNRLPETGALATPAPRTLGNALSPAGADTLKTREGGFYGDAYDDSGTGKAIGYGMHTFEGKPVTAGQHITQAQGDSEFDKQIKTTYGAVVDRALQVPVSQAQYDALVSMAWNLPAAARHVIDKLNRGEKLTAADFQKSATVQGVPNKGLETRRQAEADAFTKGTP